MTPDQERWAEALAIEQLHGDHALIWVAGRVIELFEAQDAVGVERMRQVHARLLQLSEAALARRQTRER